MLHSLDIGAHPYNAPDHSLNQQKRHLISPLLQLTYTRRTVQFLFLYPIFKLDSFRLEMGLKPTNFKLEMGLLAPLP